MTQRFQRHPFLGLFDGPDTNMTTEQRTTSTVPQQALYLMNNPFVTQQAEGLARRIIAASDRFEKRIDFACRLAWSRPARPIELATGSRYLDQYQKELAVLGISSERQEMEAWTSYARMMLGANEFVYVD